MWHNGLLAENKNLSFHPNAVQEITHSPVAKRRGQNSDLKGIQCSFLFLNGT